jgi:hypothetical protein
MNNHVVFVLNGAATLVGAFGHGPADPCGIFDMPCPY